jgi:hypothetical protein
MKSKAVSYMMHPVQGAFLLSDTETRKDKTATVSSPTIHHVPANTDAAITAQARTANTLSFRNEKSHPKVAFPVLTFTHGSEEIRALMG